MKSHSNEDSQREEREGEPQHSSSDINDGLHYHLSRLPHDHYNTTVASEKRHQSSSRLWNFFNSNFFPDSNLRLGNVELLDEHAVKLLKFFTVTIALILIIHYVAQWMVRTCTKNNKQGVLLIDFDCAAHSRFLFCFLSHQTCLPLSKTHFFLLYSTI